MKLDPRSEPAPAKAGVEDDGLWSLCDLVVFALKKLDTDLRR